MIAAPLRVSPRTPPLNLGNDASDRALSCRLRLVHAVVSTLPDERALCARAKDHDRQAMGELLRYFGPRLYRAVLLPRLGRKAAAEEALSITYSRIIERFHQFEWREVGVYPWMRVIALHVAIDLLRRERRERLFEPEDLERTLEAARRESDKTAEELERQDIEYARQRVLGLLESLNARYREAIRLRVLEGKSREQCAAALSVTVATFDVLLHRSMTALKQELGRDTEATP